MRRPGGAQTPERWELEVEQDCDWRPLPLYNTDAYGVEPDPFNVVHPPEPTTITRFRLHAQARTRRGGWRPRAMVRPAPNIFPAESISCLFQPKDCVGLPSLRLFSSSAIITPSPADLPFHEPGQLLGVIRTDPQRAAVLEVDDDAISAPEVPDPAAPRAQVNPPAF